MNFNKRNKNKQHTVSLKKKSKKRRNNNNNTNPNNNNNINHEPSPNGSPQSRQRSKSHHQDDDVQQQHTSFNHIVASDFHPGKSKSKSHTHNSKSTSKSPRNQKINMPPPPRGGRSTKSPKHSKNKNTNVSHQSVIIHNGGGGGMNGGGGNGYRQQPNPLPHQQQMYHGGNHGSPTNIYPSQQHTNNAYNSGHPHGHEHVLSAPVMMGAQHIAHIAHKQAMHSHNHTTQMGGGGANPNGLPHSQSRNPHPATPMGASVYSSRIECVWPRNIFTQTELATKFSCKQCGDIPKKQHGYTCENDQIYCEYCIDNKIRSNYEIQQKIKIDKVVGNMINGLKVKCPRYSTCKFKGKVSKFIEHERVCQISKSHTKEPKGKKVKECPLRGIGCDFGGGYLIKHFNDAQQKHFQLAIEFFESKFKKFTDAISKELNGTKKEMKRLQQENGTLHSQIQQLVVAKDEISQELRSVVSTVQEQMIQSHSQSVSKNKKYQIQINNTQKNANIAKEIMNQSQMTGTTVTTEQDYAHSNSQWSSFLNAHRRLSTKTGATVPETDVTTEVTSYASSVSETGSEGWFHALPNHPNMEHNNNNKYNNTNINIHNKNNDKYNVTSPSSTHDTTVSTIPSHSVVSPRRQFDHNNNILSPSYPPIVTEAKFRVNMNDNASDTFHNTESMFDDDRNMNVNNDDDETLRDMDGDTIISQSDMDKTMTADDLASTDSRTHTHTQTHTNSSNNNGIRTRIKSKKSKSSKLKRGLHPNVRVVSAASSESTPSPAAIQPPHHISPNMPIINNKFPYQRIDKANDNMTPNTQVSGSDDVTQTIEDTSEYETHSTQSSENLTDNSSPPFRNVNVNVSVNVDTHGSGNVNGNGRRRVNANAKNHNGITHRNPLHGGHGQHGNPAITPFNDVELNDMNGIQKMGRSAASGITSLTYSDTHTEMSNTNNNNNKYQANKPRYNTLNDEANTINEDDATSYGGTNYSCTISVRRAIQHLVPNYYEDAKQMELPSAESKMIVLDIGSCTSKVGIAGSNKPTNIFQTMIAKSNINGSRSVGDVGNNKVSNYKVSYPVERGVIQNWDDYQLLLKSVFYDKLKINPSEYHCLMTEPTLTPKSQSSKIAELCFETFNLSGLYLAQDALCSLYASGGNTGLSISSGHGITTVVPIYEGYALPRTSQKLQCAGGDVTSFLKEKLNLYGLFRSKMTENKFADSLKEKLAYVCEDFDNEHKHTMFERIVYRLPDGSEIEVGQERFMCTETLFSHSVKRNGSKMKTNSGNNDKNALIVGDLVKKALSKSGEDVRQILFENVVCSGGNTMLRGFDERLKKEIDALAPDNSGWSTRIFGLVDRKLSCWIGGSIMASLSHMDQLWITKEKYDEVGPQIVNNRSY